MNDQKLATSGPFIDLGGLWVRYDTIGTVRPTTEDDHECLVVLTIPGYKTLRVACGAETLLTTVRNVSARHELMVGAERAKGMRQ